MRPRQIVVATIAQGISVVVVEEVDNKKNESTEKMGKDNANKYTNKNRSFVNGVSNNDGGNHSGFLRC